MADDHEACYAERDHARDCRDNRGQFPGFFFHCFDQTVKAGEDVFRLCVEYDGVVICEIAEATRQMDEILGLRQGTASDVKKVQIVPLTFAR